MMRQRRTSILRILLFGTTALGTVVPGTTCRAATDPLFTEKCSVCHGGDATGGDRGPALANNRRLRTRSAADLAAIIRDGTPGGMPAFALPEDQISQLAGYVHSLNATAFEMKPDGDPAAGETFFFGNGKCGSCHVVGGRGSTPGIPNSGGPDLSNIARQMTLAEMEEALADPSARIASGYQVVDVTLKDGSSLRGFARNRSLHNLELQALDGKLHLLDETEYREVKTESASLMPPLQASADEHRDLIAWLSRLGGNTASSGAEHPATGTATQAEFASILHPAPGEWPTYHGNLNGNRYSALNQITPANVAKLQLQWIFPIQYQPLETTPLVVEGVMYVTGPNQVVAALGNRDLALYAAANAGGNHRERRRARREPGCCAARRPGFFHYRRRAHAVPESSEWRAALGCVHAGIAAALRGHFGAAGGERSGDLRSGGWG